ncbi:hypothetical protein, partial [Stenotrophomonas maltophilia]|uniref:hypothetical protein n=1 Tax=Stenotrophomonas maltophilia TaxID=40324 RepID=UPI00195429B5
IMQQNAPALRLDRRRLLALMPATAGAALLPGLARAVAAADPVQALVDDFVASGKAPGVSVAVIRDGNTRFY